MRLIDADRFCDHVLADSLTDKQRGKAEMVRRMVANEPTVDAIPVTWIREQIQLPENAGGMSSVLSRMLEKWRDEIGAH